jgi:hypothetical protein
MARRLTLRELITDSQKKSRFLSEDLGVNLIARTDDLHDLSRPVRRKSHYPTLQALHNALERAVAASEETEGLLEALSAQLDEIRDHARRERLSRP